MSPWETVGAARYAADMMKIAVGLDQFVITAEDAPALIMEGEDCDVWTDTVPPVAVGRAGYSAEGRMIVIGLPKHGLVQIAGRQIVKRFIDRDRKPCAVVVPPVPAPELPAVA